jgi:hypothetical protein
VDEMTALELERFANRGTFVKQAYVDAAGEIVAGYLLSQIMYWHADGGSKLAVERDGEKWLAKRREDWQAEIRMSPRQYDRAIGVLKRKKLVEVKLFHFNGLTTPHIRPLGDNILAAAKKAVREMEEPVSPNMQNVDAPSVSPNMQNGNEEEKPVLHKTSNVDGARDEPVSPKTLNVDAPSVSPNEANAFNANGETRLTQTVIPTISNRVLTESTNREGERAGARETAATTPEPAEEIPQRKEINAGDVARAYLEAFGKSPSQAVISVFNWWMDRDGAEPAFIARVIDECAADGFDFRYTKKAIAGKIADGIKTLDEHERREAEREAEKQARRQNHGKGNRGHHRGNQKENGGGGDWDGFSIENPTFTGSDV